MVSFEKCMYAFDAYLDDAAPTDTEKTAAAFIAVADKQFCDTGNWLVAMQFKGTTTKSLWHRFFFANVPHVEKYILKLILPHGRLSHESIEAAIIHDRVAFLEKAYVPASYVEGIKRDWISLAVQAERFSCLRILLRDTRVDISTEMAILSVSNNAVQRISFTIVRPAAQFSYAQAMSLTKEYMKSLDMDVPSSSVSYRVEPSMLIQCIYGRAPNDIIAMLLARNCFTPAQLQSAMAGATKRELKEYVSLIRPYLPST